ERQTRMADPRIQCAAQHQQFNPTCNPCRCSESRGTPHCVHSQSSRQWDSEQIPKNRRQGNANECIAQRCPGGSQGVVSGRIQPSQSRCQQAHSRACEDSPDIQRIGMSESSGLKECRRNYIAQCNKRQCRGNNEECDLTQPRVQSLLKLVCPRLIGA